MAAILNFTSLSPLVFAVLILSSLCLTEAQTTGFSVELIHRDSPKSPFYNPMETTSDRVINAVRRSFARARRFKPTSVTTKEAEYSNVTASSSEYLMKIAIGTPAYDVVAVADTGSDSIWTQCKPCETCFQQKAPLFDPSESSTYELISCRTSQCFNFARYASCNFNKTCEYTITYADQSYSNGDVVYETMTVDSTSGPPVLIPKVVIGCGHNNSLTSSGESKVSGVIGLGGGELSFISQMGSSIAGKFSYCLLRTSYTKGSSKMNFGSNAVVSGPEVVSTPLIKLDSSPTFYYLDLEAISVGDKRINYTVPPIGGPGTKGNIIIDQGTTMTLLPSTIYKELESAVASQIKFPRIAGPKGFSLCYDARTGFGTPKITMQFTGADVQLSKENAFVSVSDSVECFAFATFQEHSIYGNLAQTNFLVGYDTEKKTVSFKTTDCSL